MSNAATNHITDIARRWERGSDVRYYLNRDALQDAAGFNVDRYNTGNIASISIQGEGISNSKGKAALAALHNDVSAYVKPSGEVVVVGYRGADSEWWFHAIQPAVERMVSGLAI